MTGKSDLLERVTDALRAISADPAGGRDIVSAGQVREVSLGDRGEVRFVLAVGGGSGSDVAELVRRAVSRVPGVSSVAVELRDAAPEAPRSRRRLPVVEPGAASPGGADGRATGPAAAARPPEPQRVPGIRHVVAVSSGKGGVGKSTVASNLAAALAQRGSRVGLLDADVYGPDIPIMFGVHSRPNITPDERVVPLEAFDVKLMSLGFLLDDDTPAIWRGPIVMGIIRQFLQQVEWGELDYLIVDLPPGTGDAQLSLVQLAKVDGALMVTTPQGVATADVLKGIRMFERVDVPVLGLIENMSGFSCPHCGAHTDVFGHGGGRKLAAIAGVAMLGEVPLGAGVVEAGDAGRPTVVADPDSAEGKAFFEIAAKVAAALGATRSEAEAPQP